MSAHNKVKSTNHKHKIKRRLRSFVSHIMNLVILIFSLLSLSCNSSDENIGTEPNPSYRIVKGITYNDISVDVVIDKPDGDEFDVLMVFHGTVRRDNLILQAAHNVLERFKSILDRKDIMIISVAYPKENLLLGDNLRYCEAALLWVKHNASQELNLTVEKIFLAGHSQGGYLVTRLNTLHPTHGVIANAPGPLNLIFRCQLEENGIIPNEMECDLLFYEYGATSTNPDAYFERSLLNFTNGFTSDILFIQGLNDGPIHMQSWPVFKQQVENCNDCQNVKILELPGYGHTALFESDNAKIEFNNFINRQ